MEAIGQCTKRDSSIFSHYDYGGVTLDGSENKWWVFKQSEMCAKDALITATVEHLWWASYAKGSRWLEFADDLKLISSDEKEMVDLISLKLLIKD